MFGLGREPDADIEIRDEQSAFAFVLPATPQLFLSLCFGALFQTLRHFSTHHAPLSFGPGPDRDQNKTTLPALS